MPQLLLATTLANAANRMMAEPLARVDELLEAWSSNSGSYDALLAEVFGSASTDPGMWQQVHATEHWSGSRFEAAQR